MRAYNFWYLNELNVLKEKKKKEVEEAIKEVIDEIALLSLFL